MPDGLLLLAFALTLTINAILIVVAIRAMQPGGVFHDRGGRDRPGSRPGKVPDAAGRPEATRPASVESSRLPTSPLEPPAEARPRKVAAAPAESSERPAAIGGETDAIVATPTSSPTPAPRRAAGPTQAPARPAPKRSNGRRRRFSLPPLDEDQEKVNRSIETFLSGGEATAQPGPEVVEPPRRRHRSKPPTTVALVTVTAPTWAESHAAGTPPADGASVAGEGTAEDAALAAVERSLRAAARGTDRVELLGPGRYRVVLATTGELAARAYLRRVRATVEPLLDELDPPRRLAVATATVLDEPIDRANDAAERRLQALLEARRLEDIDASGPPRAVPD